MRDLPFRLAILVAALSVLGITFFGVPTFGDTTAADAKIAALEERVERTEAANLTAIEEMSKLVLDMSKQLADVERARDELVAQIDDIFANYATLADIAFREVQDLRDAANANCLLTKRNSNLVLGLNDYRYERQRHLITVDTLC